MPKGYAYAYANDTSDFIKLSVKEVVKTLIEAILLVVLVMFVFLQSWRATLIPFIAVPVVLLGTFAILYVLGFSINTMTLFGLVLATGLLVDDAIVVVENVERLMDENPEMTPARRRSSRWGRSRWRWSNRAGPHRGVPADGVLRRLDRRHLPSVLGDDRLGDGPVGIHRPDLSPAIAANLLKRGHGRSRRAGSAAAPRAWRMRSTAAA